MKATERVFYGAGLVLLVIWYVTLAYTIPEIISRVYVTSPDVKALFYLAGASWAAWGITSAWQRIEAKKQEG